MIQHMSCHVKASLKPEELLQMMPPAKAQLEKWHLVLHSNRALDVNSDYSGNNKSSNLKFSIKADPQAKLEVSTRFGDFFQPPNESVGLDGSFLADARRYKNKRRPGAHRFFHD